MAHPIHGLYRCADLRASLGARIGLFLGDSCQLDLPNPAARDRFAQNARLTRRKGDRIGDGDRRKFGEPWHAAHYYRFEQLILGHSYRHGDLPGQPSGPLIPMDWDAVQNTVPNPRLAQFRRAGSLAVPKLEQFNAAYGGMLAAICTSEQSGHHSRSNGQVGSG